MRGLLAVRRAAVVASVQAGKDGSPERGGKAHALSPKKAVLTKVASPRKVDLPTPGIASSRARHTPLAVNLCLLSKRED